MLKDMGVSKMSCATGQGRSGFPVLPKAGLLPGSQCGPVRRAQASESVRVGV